MGTNVSSPEGYRNHAERGRQTEETPFRLLTVKILRARNIQKADTFSETDCYVSLWLPTASSEAVRTVTIPNSKDPTWNQTFSYRIDSRVKNLLNLNIYDEDMFSKDDHLYTVLFDIGKLQTGQTSRVNFKLNPERHEELDVEFTLRNMIQRRGARVHAASPPASNPGILARGARWFEWIRSINIPRPPGF